MISPAWVPPPTVPLQPEWWWPPPGHWRTPASRSLPPSAAGCLPVVLTGEGQQKGSELWSGQFIVLSGLYQIQVLIHLHVSVSLQLITLIVGTLYHNQSKPGPSECGWGGGGWGCVQWVQFPPPPPPVIKVKTLFYALLVNRGTFWKRGPYFFFLLFTLPFQTVLYGPDQKKGFHIAP